MLIDKEKLLLIQFRVFVGEMVLWRVLNGMDSFVVTAIISFLIFITDKCGLDPKPQMAVD